MRVAVCVYSERVISMHTFVCTCVFVCNYVSIHECMRLSILYSLFYLKPSPLSSSHFISSLPLFLLPVSQFKKLLQLFTSHPLTFTIAYQSYPLTNHFYPKYKSKQKSCEQKKKKKKRRKANGWLQKDFYILFLKQRKNKWHTQSSFQIALLKIFDSLGMRPFTSLSSQSVQSFTFPSLVQILFHIVLFLILKSLWSISTSTTVT